MTSNGQGAVGPLPLDELHALRTDFEDVAVDELGGRELRVYALTGKARAILLADMTSLAGKTGNGDPGSIDVASRDPAIIREVMLFEGRVVSASLGYPQDQWDAVIDTLGEGAIERLYAVAAKLSRLDQASQDEARASLRRRRNAASGTG